MSDKEPEDRFCYLTEDEFEERMRTYDWHGKPPLEYGRDPDGRPYQVSGKAVRAGWRAPWAEESQP